MDFKYLLIIQSHVVILKVPKKSISFLNLFFLLLKDGVLTGWRYMTPHTTFGKVFFIVLRQVGIDENGPVFKIVGSTFIQNQPSDWIAGAWVTARVRPIQVQAGDYIGMFYPSLDAKPAMIPSKNIEGVDYALTHVYPLDASNIVDSKF